MSKLVLPVQITVLVSFSLVLVLLLEATQNIDYVNNNYNQNPLIRAQQGETVEIVCNRNSCATVRADWILRMRSKHFRPRTMNSVRERKQIERDYNISLDPSETNDDEEECLSIMHLNITLGPQSGATTGKYIHVLCGYSGLVNYSETHERHNPNSAIIEILNTETTTISDSWTSCECVVPSTTSISCQSQTLKLTPCSSTSFLTTVPVPSTNTGLSVTNTQSGGMLSGGDIVGIVFASLLILAVIIVIPAVIGIIILCKQKNAEFNKIEHSDMLTKN